MLQVTEDAGSHLIEVLDHAEASPDVAVRFVRDGKNLSMELDKERAGDVVIAHGGRTVLLLDDDISAFLGNRTLDVKETDEGPALAFR